MRFLAALLFAISLPAFAQKADILEVIDISGPIDESTAARMAAQVEKINENSKIKAVLLVVDTPGGSAVASSAVYEELSKLKVPVVSWCSNICASGGIFAIMAPTVKFRAVRSETISGSVGVIVKVTRFNRLLDWVRIDSETYRSGPLKDVANPTRALQDEEKKFLEGLVASLASRFYSLVDKARGSRISPAGWDEIKTAKIFIGEEAVKIGLVDAVATKEQVVSKAKELSGSKQIFTREELSKMAVAAHADTAYEAPPILRSAYGDIPWLIETLKEIRAGSSVKVEYRMPYQF